MAFELGPVCAVASLLRVGSVQWPARPRTVSQRSVPIAGVDVQPFKDALRSGRSRLLPCSPQCAHAVGLLPTPRLGSNSMRCISVSAFMCPALTMWSAQLCFNRVLPSASCSTSPTDFNWTEAQAQFFFAEPAVWYRRDRCSRVQHYPNPAVV